MAISNIKQWPTGEPYIAVVSHGNRWAVKRVCHNCCLILSNERNLILAYWEAKKQESTT